MLYLFARLAWTFYRSSSLWNLTLAAKGHIQAEFYHLQIFLAQKQGQKDLGDSFFIWCFS